MEADHDGAPSTSFAHGHNEGNSSWNPAFMPDNNNSAHSVPSKASAEPTSHAVQYPDPVPASIIDQVELAEESAPPAETHNTLFDGVPASDDDFFDRHDTPNGADTNGFGGSAGQINRLEDDLDLQHSDSKHEEQGPEYANGVSHQDESSYSGPDETETQADAHLPAQNYDYQGESTFLEDAITENETASLVADAEPPSDDWATSGEVFNLGGAPEDAPIPSGHVESVVATVGDSTSENIATAGAASQDIDWGATDDQDLFPLGNTQESGNQPAFEAHQEGHAETRGDSSWDLSLEDLSLDDDFLPDPDDSTVGFALDDDEGFLEDEPSQHVSELAQPDQMASTANRYAPQTSQTTMPAQNAYGAPSPQFTDFSQMGQKSPMAPNMAYGAYNQPVPSQQQDGRPPPPNTSQSFVDKSKGGYHSPFDLPEDIVVNRKRPAVHHAVTSPAQQIAPPRNSSMYPNAVPGPVRPPPSNRSVSSLTPPSSSHSMMGGLSTTDSQKPASQSKAPSSDFFAELPVTSKPKPPPSGRYAPQNTASTPPAASFAPPPPAPSFVPPQFQQKERTSSWSSLRNEVLPETSDLISQLQQPERLPAFPDAPPAPARSNSLPVPQPAHGPAPVPSRYSPAPPGSAQAPPAASARYSPAPPAAPGATARYSPAPPQAANHNRYVSEPPAGPPKPPVQPFAPRTSSPLAHHALSQDKQDISKTASEHVAPTYGHQAMHSADGVGRAPMRRPLEEVSELEEQEQSPDASQAPQTGGAPMAGRSETPPPRSSPSSVVGSPRKRSNYMPHYQPGAPPAPSNMPPPNRSQSQSPGATMKNPLRHVSTYDRPASAHTPTSPPSAFGLQSPTANVANILPHRRQTSHEFEYIVPSDERGDDLLKRWKGYPIFKWGVGGSVVTSFPKQVPRFGGGASMPMMKCSPGEVKLKSVKEVFPLADDIIKFPGPLKSKNKKKEVSSWLSQRVASLESELKFPGVETSMSPDDFKRLAEKVLLWKVMQIFVDHDGHLENNAAAEAAVRRVLSPDETNSTESGASFTSVADLVGGAVQSTSNVQAEPVDPRAVQELRTLLTKGDREKAVWHAVDQRLWAHAMLLSSTLGKDVWKQVVQEFVRKEVKKMDTNNQALAVLYEIFAGNWEECIDELVPASARAGFQMVSTGGSGPTQNALQGLDKWRETLSLVLNNRSDNDVQALLSLGRLLAGYGRVEAAHICFIFARSVAHISGVDDPQSDIVLIGADHKLHPLELGTELEPILLTEVYEFALSLAATGGSHIIPHLQNYKLVHAYSLAEYGHRSEAQAYCDAIAAAMKATTRMSPYYNGVFITALDDLTKRLSQSPKDGSSSWISKPSMDKVSGSLLAKFNSFIAGDDDDAASNHSGTAADVGPFARIAGNTPTLSPSQSNADLYGSFGAYASAPAPPPANSKYAPGSQYAPRSSLDQARPRFEPLGRSSMESADGSSGMRHNSDGYMVSPQSSAPYTPSQYSPTLQRPQPSKAQTYSPLKSEPFSPGGPYGSSYQNTPPVEPSANFGYQPHQRSGDEPTSLHSPQDGTSGGYEPPTSSYEPPAYEPYQPDEQEDKSPVEPKKKKSFMDDDDDDIPALKKPSKSEADRIAEENFRKAAEADAKKAEQQKKSGGGGWLSGWFKKEANPSPGPIKAKLGEENSFYYDPDLKKWVNKKGGASAPVSTPTPPPPRSGPPSRNVSGMSIASTPPTLGSSLPHNASSMSLPPTLAPTSNPQRSSSMPPPMLGVPSRASTPGVPSDTEGGSKMAPPLQRPMLPGAGSGPPSRPGTGMSTASSIDDLIGAPAARKGASKKGKKGNRYVDVMSQK